MAIFLQDALVTVVALGALGVLFHRVRGVTFPKRAKLAPDDACPKCAGCDRRRPVNSAAQT